MSLRGRIRQHLGSAPEKRSFVRDLFGRIAGRYDLTNDVMSLGLHRRWKRKLVGLARLDPDHDVLDLAAGTGDLALLAREDVTRGRVVGADLTPEMLAAARRRKGAERVTWLRCDAMELPVAEASFDRVLIGYGLRNFPDLEGSLREIRRSLKPGGELLSLDFGKPARSWLRKAYLRYLELSTTAVGWALHRDPEAYLYIPESLREHPDQPGVARTMERAGFERCGWVDLLFGTMAIHFGRRPRSGPGRAGGEGGPAGVSSAAS